MVNRELYYILEEFKKIFGSTVTKPELLYEWLQIKNSLNKNEIYSITSAGTPLSQINVLCDLLKAKPNEIFAEIYKATKENQLDEATDFLKRELEKHNFDYLLNLSNGSSDVVSREIRKTIDETWKRSKFNEKRPFLFDVKPMSFFTGREVIINEIHETIQTWEQSNGINRLVISGLGRIGKTELVLAYIHKHMQTFKSIVWINAESIETLKASFHRLAFGSNLTSESIAIEILVTQVFEALSSTFGKKSLVVFDNADEFDHQKLLPRNSDSYFFIIISRHQSWSSSEFKIIKLQEFTLKEAVKFVEELCKEDATTVGIFERTNKETNDIMDFVLALGCFPLALKQAISYIKTMAKYNKTYSFKDFLSKFNGNTDYAKNLLSFLQKKTFKKKTFTVWNETFDKIYNDISDNQEFDQNSEHANFKRSTQLRSSEILNICSYLNNENIPIDIFSDEHTQDVDQLTMSAIERLEDYCLLTVTEGSVKINKLVQLAIQLNLQEANQTEQFISTAMDLLIKKFPYNDQSVSGVHKKRTLLSHFIQLKRHIIYFEKQLNKDFFLNLVSSVMRCISETYFDIHESVLRRDAIEELLLIQEKHYGSEHPIIAITLIDLINASDDSEIKQMLLERALQIQERYYGIDNFQLVITNLANVYDNLRKEVQKMLPERVLKVEKQHVKFSQQHTVSDMDIERLSKKESKSSTVELLLQMLEPDTTKIQGIKNIKPQTLDSKLDNTELVIQTDMGASLTDGNLEWYKYLIQQIANIKAERDDETQLCLTIKKDNLDMVMFLIEKGADINVADNWNGYRWLHLAAERGNLEVVKNLIRKGAMINQAANNGTTPLHIAAQGGHFDVLKYLVEKGADINVADNCGWKPLHSAAKGGHLDIAKYLVEKGAGINMENKYSSRPLHLAAEDGHLDIVKYLVEKGADVNVADNNDWRSLHSAAQGGHLDVVKYLVEKGADVNMADNCGWKPLHLAAQGGHLNVVKYLVEKGADINVPNNSDWRSLHSAAQGGHLDVVKYLVEKGTDVNVSDNGDWRPLHSAVKGGHLDVVKYLVENGADINVADERGWRPARQAAKGGYLNVLKYLVEKGADINLPNNGGWRSLHSAAHGGHLDVVKYLVEKGIDVNVQNNDDWRPLHSAAQGGHLNVVKYLVEKGADVNVPNNGDWRSLHSAAQEGHLDVVQYLIEKRALVNVADKYGWRPLHSAAKGGYLNVVKHLVEKGADVNVPDNYGWRPLHSAAKGGHLDVVKYLVEKGADVNVTDKSGGRPLRLAAVGGHIDVEKYLVEKGADVNMTNLMQNDETWCQETHDFYEDWAII